MTIQGLIGKKIGTTQVFRENGVVDSVTALQVGPCVITQIKTVDKDGYQSVQLGFERAKRLSKPEQGHLRRSGGGSFRFLREVGADDISALEVGQSVDASIFEPGERVDVVGLSKGRGFQGGVKRHHFKGGPKTHGQSDRQRAPGSIGSGTFPGRVIKGLRMAGHMGNHTVTTRNVEIVSADPVKNLLFIKGSVPGARDSLIVIRKTGRRSK
ncbi:MAG: 50S ribosomal protein L3 [Chloroflexi bacterium]|nr:50S ribosomal protein L3 [Chloroflexota bacterium]